MKGINVIWSDIATGAESIKRFAVNTNGEGCFCRNHRGDWKQQLGNGQFCARTPREMMRKLRRAFNLEGCNQVVRMVRGSAWGWE